MHQRRRSGLIAASAMMASQTPERRRRGLQNAAACALTPRRLLLHAGIDFDILPRWPSRKARSGRHLCSARHEPTMGLRYAASGVLCVATCSKKTENALPNNTGNTLDMSPLLKFAQNRPISPGLCVRLPPTLTLTHPCIHVCLVFERRGGKKQHGCTPGRAPDPTFHNLKHFFKVTGYHHSSV